MWPAAPSGARSPPRRARPRARTPPRQTGLPGPWPQSSGARRAERPPGARAAPAQTLAATLTLPCPCQAHALLGVCAREYTRSGAGASALPSTAYACPHVLQRGARRRTSWVGGGGSCSARPRTARGRPRRSSQRRSSLLAPVWRPPPPAGAGAQATIGTSPCARLHSEADGLKPCCEATALLVGNRVEHAFFRSPKMPSVWPQYRGAADTSGHRARHADTGKLVDRPRSTVGGRLPSLEMRTPGSQCRAVTGARCDSSSMDVNCGATLSPWPGSLPVPLALASCTWDPSNSAICVRTWQPLNMQPCSSRRLTTMLYLLSAGKRLASRAGVCPDNLLASEHALRARLTGSYADPLAYHHVDVVAMQRHGLLPLPHWCPTRRPGQLRSRPPPGAASPGSPGSTPPAPAMPREVCQIINVRLHAVWHACLSDSVQSSTKRRHSSPDALSCKAHGAPPPRSPARPQGGWGRGTTTAGRRARRRRPAAPPRMRPPGPPAARLQRRAGAGGSLHCLRTPRSCISLD